MQGSRVGRLLPFAVLTTACVVVAPALLVMALPGRVDPWFGVPLCAGLSFAIARVLAALWQRSKRSSEVLFSDLMLWGWLRRMRTERRLRYAFSLVQDPDGDAGQRVQALARVSALLEERDAYTRRHSLRVTRHCEAIARALDLPDDEVARVRTAAALHDVGKCFTPRAILNKPSSLTEEEFAVIKRHPGEGADMLRGVVEPEVEAMIRHHHERLGGTGYPDGLAGGEIPVGARIIAVADTFDAITSTRTYREARPHAAALAILREEAGPRLDARAVEAFEGYYFARRGTAWSSLASGATQALAPLRELLVPITRTLPTLSAAAVVAVPLLAGGGLGAPGGDRSEGARGGGQDAIAVSPAGTRVRTASGSTTTKRGRTARSRATARARRRGPGLRRNSAPVPARIPGSVAPASPTAPAARPPSTAPILPSASQPDGGSPSAASSPSEPTTPATPATPAATPPPASMPVDLPDVALPDLPPVPELPDVKLPSVPVPVPTVSR